MAKTARKKVNRLNRGEAIQEMIDLIRGGHTLSHRFVQISNRFPNDLKNIEKYC